MKKIILALVFAVSVVASPVAFAKCGTTGNSGHGQAPAAAAAASTGHGGCGFIVNSKICKR